MHICKYACEKQKAAGKTRTHSEKVPETERSQSTREEGSKSREMDKEMKTVIREIREEIAVVREEKGELGKK
ncbi:unnamed protein product [Tenebrio molitor]|nr:unnamed protein product [Tenebrio molitor]